MKARWKSSENPLYVRIIRKKNGIRHVLLKNEIEEQSFYATNTGIFQKSQSSTFSRETKNGSESSSEEKSESAASLRKTPFSRSSTNNSGTSRSSVGCVQNPVALVVECFEKETGPREGEGDHLNDDYENVAFADRILHWLHSSNVLAKHFSGRMNETCESNGNSSLRGRPTTATILLKRPFRDKKNVRVVPESLDTVDSKPFSDSKTRSATQGRPQLHVYIPMFEKAHKLESLS